MGGRLGAPGPFALQAFLPPILAPATKTIHMERVDPPPIKRSMGLTIELKQK